MQTRFKKNAKVFDLAILAVTLKDNAATPADITSTITGMTIGDGTNTYTVSPSVQWRHRLGRLGRVNYGSWFLDEPSGIAERRVHG